MRGHLLESISGIFQGCCHKLRNTTLGKNVCTTSHMEKRKKKQVIFEGTVRHWMTEKGEQSPRQSFLNFTGDVKFSVSAVLNDQDHVPECLKAAQNWKRKRCRKRVRTVRTVYEQTANNQHIQKLNQYDLIRKRTSQWEMESFHRAWSDPVSEVRTKLKQHEIYQQTASLTTPNSCKITHGFLSGSFLA